MYAIGSEFSILIVTLFILILTSYFNERKPLALVVNRFYFDNIARLSWVKTHNIIHNIFGYFFFYLVRICDYIILPIFMAHTIHTCQKKCLPNIMWITITIILISKLLPIQFNELLSYGGCSINYLFFTTCVIWVYLSANVIWKIFNYSFVLISSENKFHIQLLQKIQSKIVKALLYRIHPLLNICCLLFKYWTRTKATATFGNL